MGRVLLPLGEVVTERVNRGHWSVTSQLGEFLGELLGALLSTEQVEFEGITFGNES